jgi:carboxypeptidase C (cathepsin A)
MRYLSLKSLLLITVTITSIACSLTNTTDFYNKEVGSKLSYESFSGYEDINWYFPKGLAAMYYSLWQGYSLPWADKTVPLIIWLQGGPGGPSQFGCFNELGPLEIKGKKGSFKVAEKLIAWNFFGHLLCIDQPVGVGFSYNNHTQKVTNSKDAANHLINFLSNFYANTPKLNLKNNPLYIAGESYAGHYILAVADKIKSNR